MATKKIKTLSLFSGAGGLDIGFHQAGFNIIASVEIETSYCATLKANSEKGKFFGSSNLIHCEDIRSFDPSPYKDVGIDCIIGGPPCQTFSAAGRRAGGVVGTRDARGRLFETYCEILKEIQPKVFIFENVYGIIGANDGAPWKEIIKSFEELGYKLRYEVLDAADYGVPQHRERLIIVGCKDGIFEFPLPTHGPDSQTQTPLVSVAEAVGDLQDKQEEYKDGVGGLYGHLLPEVPEGLNYAFFTAEMGHPEPKFAWRSKFHDLLYKVDRNRPCRTIKSQPGKFTGPFHWKNRHFNVAELKRLQSFPDDYEIVGSYGKVVEQIGNSVPPRMGYVLAMSVKEQLLLKKSKQTFQLRGSNFVSTFRTRQRVRSEDFKRIAQQAIEKKYGKVFNTLATLDVKRENYYVRSEGYFEQQKFKSKPVRKSHLDRISKIQVAQTGRVVSITSACLEMDLQVKEVSINIAGLSKYVGNVDELSLLGKIQSPSDIFYLWTNIEEALVARSRFFSLIDIYGHYANRGDTIVIQTKIPAAGGLVEKGLSFFGNSMNCGKFIELNKLAHMLEMTPHDVKQMVQEMREFRFDLRTNETHPIIGRNQIICTYPFPLLSSRALVKSKVQFLAEHVPEAQLEFAIM
jgi:DNA (cytosine-5)-methyltransferase 1